MNQKEIRAAIGAKFEAQEAIIATAKKDNDAGKMTEEQATAFDAIKAEIESLETDLARAVGHDEMKARLSSAPPPPATLNQPGTAPAATPGLDVHTAVDETCGFVNMGEYAQCVHRAQKGMQTGRDLFDPRIKAMYEEFGSAVGTLDPQGAPTNVHVESGEDEGLMVPPEFRKEIWTLIMDGEDVLSMMKPETTSSNQVAIVRDQSTPWDATGIQTRWEGEAKQLTASKLATKGDLVRLHKHFAFVNASDELIEDAPLLNSRLMVMAPQAINWNVSEAIVNGDGAGKPLGWAQSDARVVIDKEVGQTKETINADNVSKMYAAMWPAGHRDSFWMIGPNSLPQFFTMTLGDKPIWVPPDKSFQDAPGGFLFGRPIRINQHANTVGSEGDIHYVSPTGYYSTVKAGGIRMDSSIHLFFDFGVQSFRWQVRVGGQPFASTTIAQDKSADPLSHFVVLAVRA